MSLRNQLALLLEEHTTNEVAPGILRDAIEATEQKLLAREHEFDHTHPLHMILGRKSAIGEFGEELAIRAMNAQERTNDGHDMIVDGRKYEIKSSRVNPDGTYFHNQIYFEKDWDALLLLFVDVDVIRAYTAYKDDDIQKYLTVNNGYAFKGREVKIAEAPEFELAFEVPIA